MRGKRGAWVVAAALACTVLGDAAAAVHVRGELRERELAAARALDDAWVAQVRDVAVGVQAARAPIADAAHLVLADLASAVRYDVYVRGAAGVDFAALQQQLAGTGPPAHRRPVQAELTDALDGMTGAVSDLADEQDEDVEDESRAFAAAASRWDVAVAEHIAQDLPLATTDRSDVPLTQAGRVFRWSSACARGLLEDERAGEGGEDPEQAAQVFDTYARAMDTTLDQLLAVPLTGADEQTRRDLEPRLRGLRPAARALEDFAAALRSDSPERAEAALLELDRVAPLLDAAAAIFQVAGSSLCADYFDPGPTSLAEPPPGDDATQT